MLASILLSSPGPIVVGLGLLLGRSSTQFADFIRRSAEFAAMIVSFIVFHVTRGESAACASHKEKLERIANRCVGAAMCLSGTAMLLLSFLQNSGEKGNVIPGLSIAFLGVITNTWFWIRYRKLYKASFNAILAVQSRLYRAKSIVDVCVVLALSAVALFPESPAAFYMDAAGSFFVAFYLFFSGIITIVGKHDKNRS